SWSCNTYFDFVAFWNRALPVVNIKSYVKQITGIQDDSLIERDSSIQPDNTLFGALTCIDSNSKPIAIKFYKLRIFLDDNEILFPISSVMPIAQSISDELQEPLKYVGALTFFLQPSETGYKIKYKKLG
ncbi:MAG TPA: hypothetical protein PK390_05405, partial [Fervidobacterium nodosum]|nr:hypothetical protein [Fervidobacterium nodosum]